MQRGFGRFVAGRAVQGLLFVAVVSSAAFLLTRLAPGDFLSALGSNRAVAAAERHRLGLDRPVLVQYASWLRRAIRLDLGTSLKYQRPVTTLVRERATNTIVLGAGALLIATVLGIGIGTLTGSGRCGRLLTGVVTVASITLLSVPPLVMSFSLLLLAAITGWLPVGGFPMASASAGALDFRDARYLILPTLALALPLAASLERLQAAAIREALAERSILGGRARGLSTDRLLWRHALRLSLPSTLSICGIVFSGVLSGSLAVEVVMSWPGLGALMYEALVARDLYLVAGCAVAVSTMLAGGVLASDVALAVVDPRYEGWS